MSLESDLRAWIVPLACGGLRGARWIAYGGGWRYWLGAYHPAACAALARAAAPGATVYDVGAHAGYYSLLAARLVGPRGVVVAFEPLLRSVRLLRAHLRVNGVSNVRVVAAAVAERGGTARFGPAGERGGEQADAAARLDPGGVYVVPAIALDEFVADGGAPPPDCIKLDAQGAELGVLRGAARLLARHGPAVLLCAPDGAGRAACCARLRAHGYALQELGEGVLAERAA